MNSKSQIKFQQILTTVKSLATVQQEILEGVNFGELLNFW